jgi:hypothetical protein
MVKRTTHALTNSYGISDYEICLVIIKKEPQGQKKLLPPSCNIAHSSIQKLYSDIRDSRDRNSFALNTCINLVGIILLLAIYQPIIIDHVHDSIGLGNKVRAHASFLFSLLICLCPKYLECTILQDRGSIMLTSNFNSMIA